LGALGSREELMGVLEENLVLQIISGKFFNDTDKVNEKASDAILYSNFSWIIPINVGLAELRPVSTSGDISSYVMRYTGKYQAFPGDVLVMPSCTPAVEQFRLLSSFWFRAFFHSDRQHVETLCRRSRKYLAESATPSELVAHYFKVPHKVEMDEITGFTGFINTMLGLPRAKYKQVIACLGAFFDALEAIDTNFDLAYSMFVYLLESLSQSNDNYVPEWDDYDQTIRSKLDSQFESLDPQISEGIRKTLLDAAHLKLTKRFIDFTSLHITDNFFRKEAIGLNWAIAKHDLERALKNVYATRSGYVHKLDQVHHQIHNAQPGWDTTEWGNEPFLTLEGLVRLCRHVLMTFISRQPQINKEEIEWRNDLSGTRVARLHPQYWVWKHEGFEGKYARHTYGGFASLVLEFIQTPNTAFPDMRDLMAVIEKLAPDTKGGDRKPLLAIYELWHNVIREDGRRANWEKFLRTYKSEIATCSMERLANYALLGETNEWTTAEKELIVQKYYKSKYSTLALNLPILLEVAIASLLANQYLEEGYTDQFARWIDILVLDLSGRPHLQSMLEACKANNSSIDIDAILGRSPTILVQEPQTDALPAEVTSLILI
jgi:hypothetical protein